MKITRLESELLRVPLKRPVTLGLGQEPQPVTHLDLVLVHLHTTTPHHGLGFTYTLPGSGVALKSLLDGVIAPMLVGQNPAQVEALFQKSKSELDTIGFAGLVARAYAAADFALWDWKGKTAGLPVAQLLGGYRTKLKAIVVDTATPALGTRQALKETNTALELGAAGVQIDIGAVDPELDEERLKQLRDGIPDGAWFEVAANGRYDFATAVYMGVVSAQDYGIDSYNDPLRPDDLDNLNRLVNRVDVGVAVGALLDRPEDFVRLLNQGGISGVRIDPLRLGGLTPMRKIAHLAEMKQVAIYPVKLPEIGAHICGASLYGRMCEYVDWFAEVFDDGPQFENGQLAVPDQPGLGISVNEKVAASLRV